MGSGGPEEKKEKEEGKSFEMPEMKYENL